MICDKSFLVPFSNAYIQKPPTVYAILESIVNGDKENEDDYIKIKDLAKEGRTTIFNFDYPLSQYVSRETFETMILNHFLMRRIGFETVTAFQIQLNVKLNEIMPNFNKLFDSLENWDIFADGEKTERDGFDNRENNTENNLTNNSNTETTSDRRNSELPQNQLQNLRDGSYVTDYNFDTDTAKDTSVSQGKSNTKDENVYHETIKRTNANKIEIYKEMQTNIKAIYSLIFDELDNLFYQLI